MASAAAVTNIGPKRVAVDPVAVTKQKEAENAAQAERIQHERDLKVADDDRKRADRENNTLTMQTEDAENKLEKTVHDKITMEIVNHDLKIDRDRLQHNLDNEVRKCEREKEKLEKDLNCQMESKKIKNEMELETNRRKAEEEKQKQEKKIEKLATENAKLTETISNKESEISDLKNKSKEEIDEKKQQLIEEWEEKIRSIQDEHDQDIMERDLVEQKLGEEKKNLDKDREDLQDENEDNLAQQQHEFQQTLQSTMEEVNEKWRKKFDNLEQQKATKEQMLRDSISHLEAKTKDEVDASEAQWKLIVKQKENEIEFMKSNMEKDLEKALDICKNIEDEMKKKQLEYENELKVKLNERELEVKEECKKKLEERIKKVSMNLKYEMDLKEKDYKFQMERKVKEMAAIEDSLSRAVARKNELENKLRLADRNSCKAQITRVTRDESNKVEDMARRIFKARRFNIESD